MKLKSLILMLSICFLGYSQSQNVTIDLSRVDPDLKSKIEAAQTVQSIETKVNTYGRWVGIGKEIGTVIDESLKSITQRSNELANTKVGKFTMFIVAYKVIGMQLIQLIFGFLIFVVITTIYIWILRLLCLPIKNKAITGEGKDKIINIDLVQQDKNHAILGTSTTIYIVCLLIDIAVIFAH